MYKLIFDFFDKHLTTFVILIIIILCFLWANDMVVKLYDVQSEIVLHDYGQVFETIEDWKIWRLEHQ